MKSFHKAIIPPPLSPIYEILVLIFSRWTLDVYLEYTLRRFSGLTNETAELFHTHIVGDKDAKRYHQHV